MELEVSNNASLPLFARRLADARQRAGISQAELGRRAGFDAGASPRINQYETGRHMPNPGTIKRMAEILGVPAAYLFADDEQLAKLLLIWADMTPSERDDLLRRIELSSVQDDD